MLAHVQAAHVLAPILLTLSGKESPGFVYAFQKSNEPQLMLSFGDNQGEKYWKRHCILNDKLMRTRQEPTHFCYDSRDPKKPAHGQPMEVPPLGNWGGAVSMGDDVFAGISGFSEEQDEAGALAITAYARGNWDFPHLKLREPVQEILKRIQALVP